MSLDSTSCAEGIAAAYIPVQASGDITGWAAAFATAYHDYAEAGVIPGAVSGGGDKSIIETAITQVDSSGATSVILGQALADYWSGVGLVPESPNLASVNNASSLQPAFTAAILSCITQTDTKPYFKNLIDAVEGVAKTIAWTITPPPPAPPFPSNVS